MNAIIFGVLGMLILCFLRINVLFSLIAGALIAGLSSGLSLTNTLEAFNHGMENGANIALSYALLGAFAASLSASGVPDLLLNGLISIKKKYPRHIKGYILLFLLLIAICSQNLVPIHIAFIPILLPPLLPLFSQLKLDRRIVSCLIIFGLCATYLVIPFGFGDIYLNQILSSNLAYNNVSIDPKLLPLAMSIPVSGMLIGLLFATFITYRKKRDYIITPSASPSLKTKPSKQNYLIVFCILILSLAIQIITGSILISALAGCLAMLCTQIIPYKQSDAIFTEGMKVMAFAGFVMMTASGLGEVLKATGEIPALIELAKTLFANNKNITALVMLLCGLIITMGIGSSFSSVPILATIYVPLSIEMGFSPLATAVILGTSCALGDASSPASEATIGPTIGLNMDKQHNHIQDTVLPAFIHFSIPTLLFGWIAAIVL